MFKCKFSQSKCFVIFLCLSSVVTMVIKSAVEDEDSGWGLGIPDKMKNNANWVDITHDFKGACKGTGSASHCDDANQSSATYLPTYLCALL